jgi:copper chaperone CopZ
VQAALSSVEGVEGVDVDYTAKTATVKTNGHADTEAMVSALKAAGYGATVSTN